MIIDFVKLDLKMALNLMFVFQSSLMSILLLTYWDEHPVYELITAYLKHLYQKLQQTALHPIFI